MKLCPKCQKQFSDDANFCPVDAARLVPLEAQAGGQDSLTARFDLGPRLGGSRTGAVHRATDKTNGRPVSVKLVSPAVVALPGVAQRLERELKQLERVKTPGVCQVIASGKRGEEYWVATELLEGAQTLAEAIGARGPLPGEQAAELIEVIGEALIEAAQVGVVHRDLAPKNILFAGQDIKLINFSVPVPTSDKVPGVAEFVAPEQVEGRPVDQRSNLYSLGALYYYVLTGQTPFAGSPADVHQQHVSATVRPPSQLVAVPPPVEAVILRALDRSPTKRFLTVRQFVDEVTRVGHPDVIELKPNMAAGAKQQRNRGELMQTLLGFKGVGGLPGISSAPTINPQPPVTPGQVAAAAAPMAMPPGTMLGIPGGPGGHAAPLPHQGGGQPMMPPPMEAPAAVDASRSPWAPPGGQPPMGQPPMGHAPMQPPMGHAPMQPPMGHAPMPQPMAPVVAQQPMAPAGPVLPAAPVVPQQPAAPVMPAAPVVAAPQVAQTPAGKKRGAPADDGKGKFRETMWFKKGDLDAQAAVAAAEERARTGKDAATDKADTKPIDERYNDDGSITRGDKEKYSLRTGATQMMPSMKDMPGGGKASQSLTKVSEDELIGEMKGLPKWLIATIALAVLAIAGIVIAVMT